MEMDAKTLKALKGSIKKWVGIVNGKSKDAGTKNCPLCKEFLVKNCEGCPVKAKVNRFGRGNTPYELWFDFFDSKYLNIPVAISDLPKRSQAKAKRLAQAELDFLKGLLP